MHTFSRRYLFFAGKWDYWRIFPYGLLAQEKLPVMVFSGIFWTFTGVYLALAKVHIVVVCLRFEQGLCWFNSMDSVRIQPKLSWKESLEQKAFGVINKITMFLTKKETRSQCYCVFEHF